MRSEVKNNINKKDDKRHTGWKWQFYRSLCVLLCLCCFFSAVPVAHAVVLPTEKSVISQIGTTYTACLKNSGRPSFDGYCASYVNHQLCVLGINKKIIGGNGKDEFDTYKNMNTTSGGYTVHAYPSATYDIRSAIAAITSACNVVTNVMVGFDRTATAAGSIYGHVFLIHAIIDGNIYYSESFKITVGGVTYPEGMPIKCTIDQLVAKYNSSFYKFDGIIWFEDEDLTAACIGGGTSTETPDEPSDDPIIGDGPGTYRVNAVGGLRVRAGNSTSTERLATLPNNTVVVVTEVSDNGWGRVFAGGYDGWISLDFAVRIGGIPAVMSDVYNSTGTQILQNGYSNLSDAVAAATSLGDDFKCMITLNADSKLTKDTVIGNNTSVFANGYSLDTAGNMLDINGGKLTSTSKVAALDAVPFVTCSQSGAEYVYTSTVSIEIRSAFLSVSDNVAMGFKATVSGVGSGKNTDVVLIVSESDGTVNEFKAQSSSGSEYSFVTGGISAKRLADRISARVRMRTTVNGIVYERTGTPIEYSPVQYVDSMYGSNSSNAKLDAMLASMLNYGAAAQKYFDYNPSDPANSLLGDAVRKLKWDEDAVVRAEFAPAVSAESTSSISSAQLVFLDNIAIRLNVKGNAQDSQLKLLVWTAEEYAGLVKEAEKAGVALSEYLVSSRCKNILDCQNGSFTLDGITAKQYADTYYFRLCETVSGKTAYDSVVAYSITEYCHYKLKDGIADEMDELCQAIAEYSAATREYFGYAVNGH